MSKKMETLIRTYAGLMDVAIYGARGAATDKNIAQDRRDAEVLRSRRHAVRDFRPSHAEKGGADVR